MKVFLHLKSSRLVISPPDRVGRYTIASEMGHRTPSKALLCAKVALVLSVRKAQRHDLFCAKAERQRQKKQQGRNIPHVMVVSIINLVLVSINKKTRSLIIMATSFLFAYFVKDKIAFFLNPPKAFVASLLFVYSKIRTSFFSNTVITHIVKSPFNYMFL